MPKQTIFIDVTVDRSSQVAPIQEAFDIIVRNVSADDLVKLASKIKQNPKIVKTALKFIS